MTVRQAEEDRGGLVGWRGGGEGWGGWLAGWLDEWNVVPTPPYMPEETGVCLSDSIKSVALWRTKLPAPATH